jgi:hypothetical protein
MLKLDLGYMLIGFILITIGLLNPFGILALPDTTPPQFNAFGSYPSSTIYICPTIISHPDPWVLVMDEHGVVSVTLRCRSTDLTYDSGAVNAVFSGTITIGGVTWEEWRVIWRAPSLARDKVYSFTWTATDKVGNSASLTTYGGYEHADGYFNVSRKLITSPTERIRLGRETIDISFTATKLHLSIHYIDVIIKKQDGTVLKSGFLEEKVLVLPLYTFRWYGKSYYTFREDGIYIIQGQIASLPEEGKEYIRREKMSLIVEVGSSFVWPLSPLRTLLAAAGVMIVIYVPLRRMVKDLRDKIERRKRRDIRYYMQ